MDRYALLNAIEKVDGYYFPTAQESASGLKSEAAFSRAKAECLTHLQKQIEQIDSLSFAEFAAPKRAA